MEGVLKDLKLTEIVPNPLNFRIDFSGSEFDEMVASVKQNGVVQPILVRPKDKKYEIVFGERRYRAAKVAAKTKGGKKTIPATVRDLSDAEAYELMVLENFQRKNLSEYEEALGFADYLEKNGKKSLTYLAERTGIKPAYIRRRVSVMKLPAPILEAWRDGEIRYGYLEQLARLDDEQEIMKWFDEVMDGYSIDSVSDLKQTIDYRAISFEYARFDLKSAGCLRCNANTDVQLKLFEVDAEKTKCLKPDCFKEKQTAWLMENWKESEFYRKFKTNGFRFTNDMNQQDRQEVNIFKNWDAKKGQACLQCDAFITGLTGIQTMGLHFERMCIGEASCFKKMDTSEKPKGETEQEGETEQDEKPRVEWHGVHFREIFYENAIPQRFSADVAPGEAQSVRLALFALLKGHSELKHWFMETYGGGDTQQHYWMISDKALFGPIEAMDLSQANEALKAATMQAVMLDDFLAEGRHLVANHIGVDLSKEWAITEEYLGKKHIPEILGMGQRLGIFSDPKAKAYLADVIGKKSFDKCKKPELIKVILESGVELIGKVPDEILN